MTLRSACVSFSFTKRSVKEPLAPMKRVLFNSQVAPRNSIGAPKLRYDDLEDELNEHYVSYDMIRSASKAKGRKTRIK